MFIIKCTHSIRVKKNSTPHCNQIYTEGMMYLLSLKYYQVQFLCLLCQRREYTILEACEMILKCWKNGWRAHMVGPFFGVSLSTSFMDISFACDLYGNFNEALSIPLFQPYYVMNKKYFLDNFIMWSSKDLQITSLIFIEVVIFHL
jgi:hypothetical protein